MHTARVGRMGDLFMLCIDIVAKLHLPHQKNSKLAESVTDMMSDMML